MTKLLLQELNREKQKNWKKMIAMRDCLGNVENFNRPLHSTVFSTVDSFSFFYDTNVQIFNLINFEWKKFSAVKINSKNALDIPASRSGGRNAWSRASPRKPLHICTCNLSIHLGLGDQTFQPMLLLILSKRCKNLTPKNLWMTFICKKSQLRLLQKKNL